MLDGLEITQFTYFQQCGGIDLDPICAELTYGLERIAAFLQDVDSIYDIVWKRDSDGTETKYRDVRYEEELQMSVYNFEKADIGKMWKHLEMYQSECQDLIGQYWAVRKNEEDFFEEQHRLNIRSADVQMDRSESERFPLLAAYELCLKCSHLFNLLDARGAISVTERVGVIARIRQLAVGLAKAYVAQQNAGVETPEQQKGGAA
jgi:glycyl-tRNA synthetase alpha chain